MLRPRDGDAERPRLPDPLVSFTVFFLGVIAVGLLAVAILAVYTYSTPDVELPLVIAIALAFSALLFVNVIGLGVRQVRRLRTGR
jgi:NO-binding membrane sensor protein with MHYT domain